MKNMLLEKMKNRVDKVGRLKVSEKLAMPYNTLSNKLNGYTKITAAEAMEIDIVVKEMEK